MILWRGWEFAAYRRFVLPEPVLDIGCGDGRFFRLLFPDCQDVVGVELDQGTARNALDSGVYRDVHVMAADALPANAERFGSAFANCSLEHMDNLHDVLSGIHASLQPGAPFLCSVVTDRFTQWSPLPVVLEAAGAPVLAREVQRGHEAYHHLANPLSREEWCSAFERAGFVVEQHIPIVPELAARLFLFVDQFVHLPRGGRRMVRTADGVPPALPGIPGRVPSSAVGYHGDGTELRRRSRVRRVAPENLTGTNSTRRICRDSDQD